MDDIYLSAFVLSLHHISIQASARQRFADGERSPEAHSKTWLMDVNEILSSTVGASLSGRMLLTSVSPYFAFLCTNSTHFDRLSCPGLLIMHTMRHRLTTAVRRRTGPSERTVLIPGLPRMLSGLCRNPGALTCATVKAATAGFCAQLGHEVCGMPRFSFVAENETHWVTI